MMNIIAVILGGGRGTRLYPLTLDRAKPAVSIAGKYRLIDITLSNCINSGIKRVYVITQFMSASLHRHIMQTYQFDVFTDGFVEILAAAQTPQREAWFQGTADAVRASLRHVTYYKADATLILSGDHLYRMNYDDMVRCHFDRKADITLAVCPVGREDASRMGLLRVDGSGKVEEFVEKPKDAAVIERFRAPLDLVARCGLTSGQPLYLASMGIYVFNPEVLVKLLDDSAQTDFGKEIIPSAIKARRVAAFPFVGYWRDIGTIKSLFDEHILMTQPRPPFSLYEPGWPIYTRSRNLPPSRVIQSEVRNSLMAEGCDITGARIANSVIGLRSVVRPGAKLSEVVMMGADYYEGEELLQSTSSPPSALPPLGIGANCVIERAIIDKNARLGDGVLITAKPDGANLEGTDFWVRDGITVIPRNAVVAAGTRI